MSEFDWSGLGKNIKDLVEDAIHSSDYEKLNRDINAALRQVMDGVESTVREAGKTAGQALDEAARNFQQAKETEKSERKQQTKRAVPVYKGPLYISTGGRKVSSMAMAVLGFLLAAVFAGNVLGIVFKMLGGLLSAVSFAVQMCLMGIPMLIAISLGVRGIARIGKLQRFRGYLHVLGDRAFCDLQELAFATGRKVNQVRKDLRWMIEKNWFLEGHLDRQETCLIVTHDMYQTYLKSELQREQRLKEEKEAAWETKKQQAATAEQGDGLPKEVQEVLEAGEAYLWQIRTCNEDIPGEEISAKISRIEHLVQQIFVRVKAHPETVSDIRKMMEYYLPTTVKLLEAYAQLDAQRVQGEHIARSKREIEEVLDTLNVAFEKLLDNLFRDTAWDVSADISVLETMLAQEGLTEDDFGREPK